MQDQDFRTLNPGSHGVGDLERFASGRGYGNGHVVEGILNRGIQVRPRIVHGQPFLLDRVFQRQRQVLPEKLLLQDWRELDVHRYPMDAPRMLAGLRA